MKKLKLYLETSVWNFVFADDAPEKKLETRRFFEEIQSGNYELYISELVITEIKSAPEPLKGSLLKVVNELEPEELIITEEVGELALKYMDSNLVPEEAFRDLVHLAVATVNNMDFLVSWNLSHIVKVKTKIGVNVINAIEGYRDLKICTVQEVLS
ncbi:MAG: PIN domain nuclease [bacterium]